MRIDLLTPGLAHLRPLRSRERRRLFNLGAFHLRDKGHVPLALLAVTARSRAAAAGTRRAGSRVLRFRARTRRRARTARARSAAAATRRGAAGAFGAKQLEWNRTKFFTLGNDREFQAPRLRIGDQIFDLAELLPVLCFHLGMDDLLADPQRLLALAHRARARAALSAELRLTGAASRLCGLT